MSTRRRRVPRSVPWKQHQNARVKTLVLVSMIGERRAQGKVAKNQAAHNFTELSHA